MENKGTIRQNSVKNREHLEESQEMSQQEFEELFMKVKFITFGIMGNINWEKVKPLKFKKDQEGKESALLMFEIGDNGCFIEFTVSEENKQELQKKTAYEIVESFVFQHLVNYGKNGYFDDKCPQCKQTTLSKSLIMNSLDEEAICCNLCGWANSMERYLKYLDEKKYSPSLKFPEWIESHNKWWEKKQ